jgi:hypothetical protein
MSDEPKNRSRAWIGWAALALLVLYPISSFPVCLARAYLESWGLISRGGHTEQAITTIYAPLSWVIEETAVGDSGVIRFLSNAFDAAGPRR